MQAVYISEMPVVTAEEDSALAYISLTDAFIAMLSYSFFFSFLGAGSNSNLISCNTNLLNFNFILRCCLFEK